MKSQLQDLDTMLMETQKTSQKAQCELVQTYLKRYLSGEEITESLIEDCRFHLQSCHSCLAVAAKRKQTLNSLLNQHIEKEVDPEKHHPQTRHNKRRATSALLDAISQKQTEIFEKISSNNSLPPYMKSDALSLKKSHLPQASTQFLQKNWKTLTLFGAFSFFLIIISHVMADPTSLLGKKASEAEDKQVEKNEILATLQLSGVQNKSVETLSRIQKNQPEKEEKELVPEGESTLSTQPDSQTQSVLADLDPAELKPEQKSFATDKVLSFAKTELPSIHPVPKPIKNNINSAPKDHPVKNKNNTQSEKKTVNEKNSHSKSENAFKFKLYSRT